ncbi:MAG: radical SAM protein [archaeon]
MQPKKIDFEMLHVFVTDRCNMRCPHCYVDSTGRYTDELTTEEMTDLFQDLNSINFTDGIHIEGGEPFLRKDLIDILTVLNDLSKVTIATNGTIPYRPEFDELKGIQRIGFSVEGVTQETHAKLRPNNLKKLLDNMVSFQDNGFSIQSRTTLTSQNYGEIEGIIAKDADRGIPIARFMAFTPVGRGTENQHLELDMQQYRKSIENYIQTVKKYGDKVMIKLSVPTPIAEKLDLKNAETVARIERSICYKGCDQAAIASNGDVFQCYNNLGYPKNKYGNIRDKNFSEIISSDDFGIKTQCPNKSCVSKERGYTHLINKS